MMTNKQESFNKYFLARAQTAYNSRFKKLRNLCKIHKFLSQEIVSQRKI